MNYTKENWKNEPTAQEYEIYYKVKAHVDLQRLNDFVNDEYDITLEDVDDTIISEILEEYADRTTSYDDELAFAAKGHGLSRPIHTWMDDALDEFNAIYDSVR